MTDPVANARTLFPTIQITLVSIVVALALQELLSRLPTRRHSSLKFTEARICCLRTG